MSYYNGGDLLSKKDLDGKEPEIYGVFGNRAAGKSYFFKRKMIRDFIKKGWPFAYLVRYNSDLAGVGSSFFKDIGSTEKFLQGKAMTSKMVAHAYSNLYLDGQICGYAIALNSLDKIKTNSSVFVDVKQMLFDEFQPESNKYLPDEIGKLISIHSSVARGEGKHARRVPVYLVSNAVTITNPYFIQFGIHKRLKEDTRFLKGHGWVFEQTFNESAAEEIKRSGFYRAFENTNQMGFVVGNRFLLDSDAFLAKFNGGIYCLGFVYHGKKLGLWLCRDNSYIISEKYDPSCKIWIACTVEDHGEGLIYERVGNVVSNYKKAFNMGKMFFENMRCKNAFMDCMSIH